MEVWTILINKANLASGEPDSSKNEGYVGRGIEVLLSYYQVDQNY